MTHNDVLRSLRYLLNVDDAALADIFQLGNCAVSRAEVVAFLKTDDEDGYQACAYFATSKSVLEWLRQYAPDSWTRPSSVRSWVACSSRPTKFTSRSGSCREASGCGACSPR
jgi:hypothetical protein